MKRFVLELSELVHFLLIALFFIVAVGVTIGGWLSLSWGVNQLGLQEITVEMSRWNNIALSLLAAFGPMLSVTWITLPLERSGFHGGKSELRVGPDNSVLLDDKNFASLKRLVRLILAADKCGYQTPYVVDANAPFPSLKDGCRSLFVNAIKLFTLPLMFGLGALGHGVMWLFVLSVTGFFLLEGEFSATDRITYLYMSWGLTFLAIKACIELSAYSRS